MTKEENIRINEEMKAFTASMCADLATQRAERGNTPYRDTSRSMVHTATYNDMGR